MLYFRLNTKYLSLFFLLSPFVWLVGCGGDPDFGQVPAKAIIKVDGVPMEEVAVVLIDDTGNNGFGRTDSNGVAEIRSVISTERESIEVKGILPGDYRVSTTRTEVHTRFNPETQETVYESTTYHVPARYNDPTRSGLTASVKKGEPNEFTFELTSQ